MSDVEVPAADASGKKGKKDKKDKKDKGGKSNMVPAVLLMVGMLGAGYMLGPGRGATPKASAEAPKTPKLVPGDVATIEPININLAGGHFLRVGVALQLVEGIDIKVYTAGKTAIANDILISDLGGATLDQVASKDGLAKIKADLKDRIVKAYKGPDGDEVMDIYFTNFVMQ